MEEACVAAASRHFWAFKLSGCYSREYDLIKNDESGRKSTNSDAHSAEFGRLGMYIGRVLLSQRG